MSDPIGVSSSRPTVLLATADDWLREALARELAADGWRALRARDGFSAWESFREAAGEVDLVIADLHLAGLEGLPLARGLRTVEAGLAVLLLAPGAQPGVRRALRAEGMRLLRLPMPLEAVAARARSETDRRRVAIDRSREAGAAYAVA